ncbi:SDR family oxidoreductase [Nevskia sp.]|uniref:SDR family oxidoreductase n=1 Tax=Nevskia sp. TaxID=1929292 RepID=UPI0025EFD0E7|nr:SDR family oxidoreductase [Nevskia sp.]
MTRVFITGGASGLGRALAEAYARDGAKVCIGDVNAMRGSETLAALDAMGATAHYLPCDVTKEADLEAAAAWLQTHWGGVDLVFNNAGVADAGGIDEMPMADWHWMVDINLLGVVRGCKVFAPMMKAQGSGHLVNVASMAGLIHPPMMSAYNATKAAVVALSETLQAELFPHGIKVSVVCPAFFRTNLAESVRTANSDMAAITKKLVNKSKIGADEIAALVKASVAKGDFHVLTHPREKRIWLFKRAVPFQVYAAAMRRQMAKMMKKRPAAPVPSADAHKA